MRFASLALLAGCILGCDGVTPPPSHPAALSTQSPSQSPAPALTAMPSVSPPPTIAPTAAASPTPESLESLLGAVQEALDDGLLDSLVQRDDLPCAMMTDRFLSLDRAEQERLVLRMQRCLVAQGGKEIPLYIRHKYSDSSLGSCVAGNVLLADSAVILDRLARERMQAFLRHNANYVERVEPPGADGKGELWMRSEFFLLSFADKEKLAEAAFIAAFGPRGRGTLKIVENIDGIQYGTYDAEGLHWLDSLERARP